MRKHFTWYNLVSLTPQRSHVRPLGGQVYFGHGPNPHRTYSTGSVIRVYYTVLDYNGYFSITGMVCQDDVIKWEHLPHHWPFVKGTHRLPVDSPHKGQWRRTLILFFYLRLNKCLSKQSIRRWFETPSHSLWRHCYVTPMLLIVNYFFHLYMILKIRIISCR